MANLVLQDFVASSTPVRRRLIFISPVVIVALGQLTARTLGLAIGIWSWLPLVIGYWIALFLLIAWLGGREAIERWLRPSQGSRLWLLLAVVIAVLPALPMLFPDTWRLFLQPRVLLPTLLFVLVNPYAEEGYWRGLLLDGMAGKNKWLLVLYSSLLFTLNHTWMAVMVVGARNPVGSVYQFIFGVLMSVLYLRTQSLRWPVAVHFLTNLLTPTVAIFLNLYIPGAQ